MAYLPVLIVFVLYFAGIPIAFALFGAASSYFTFIDTSLQYFYSSKQNGLQCLSYLFSYTLLLKPIHPNNLIVLETKLPFLES